MLTRLVHKSIVPLCMTLPSLDSLSTLVRTFISNFPYNAFLCLDFTVLSFFHNTRPLSSGNLRLRADLGTRKSKWAPSKTGYWRQWPISMPYNSREPGRPACRTSQELPWQRVREYPLAWPSPRRNERHGRAYRSSPMSYSTRILFYL